MLKKTEKKTRYTFAVILVLVVGYIVYYLFNQPENIVADNQFFKDVSVYQGYSKPNEKPNVIFAVNWLKPMKKETVENKDNFTIKQVKPDGKNWVDIENPKICTIKSVQYVYAPWVDTAEKRSKAKPSEREKKITQLFANIDPLEQAGEYYKITAINIESVTGEKIESEESGIVEITAFNKLIKR